MSDESEVDKVLSRAAELRKSLGRAWTVVVLLFALWTVRKRVGVLTAMASVAALLIAGWLKTGLIEIWGSTVATSKVIRSGAESKSSASEQGRALDRA
jgi:hypothetical protein